MEGVVNGSTSKRQLLEAIAPYHHVEVVRMAQGPQPVQRVQNLPCSHLLPPSYLPAHPDVLLLSELLPGRYLLAHLQVVLHLEVRRVEVPLIGHQLLPAPHVHV